MFGDSKLYSIKKKEVREVVRYFTSIKFWWINFFLLTFPFQIFCQLQQNERIELPLFKNDEPFEIMSAGKDGLILFRRVSLSNANIQLIYVDTSFQQKWSGILPVEKKFVLAHKAKQGQNLFFLFHHKEFSEINFQVYSVTAETGLFTRYTIPNYIPFTPTHFEITEKGALIGGYFAGKIPVILFYDFGTQKSKILPGLFNEPGELIQIKNNEDETFSIIIGAKNQSRQKTLSIKDYTSQGDLRQNYLLKPSENYNLLFGKSVSVGLNNQIVAGVYGNRNSDYSKGLFIAEISNGETKHIKYYPFSDLENFFAYMKAERQQRVKDRIKRKTIKGKKIRLQYRFLVNELVSSEGQFVLLGEAFYPVFKSLDRSYYGGGLVPGSLIFDGYKYTHAVIIGFGKEGKLLWDNSFEINDIKTFTLEQYVKMDVQDDKIVLLYLFDDKIRSKVIKDNKVLEGKSYNQLTMSFNEDISSEDQEIGKLNYWYDGSFLASGVQYTTDKRFGRQNRRVFFVNKLRYR